MRLLRTVFGTLLSVRKHSKLLLKYALENWSSYYAMAVIDLAEAVSREMQNSR